MTGSLLSARQRPRRRAPLLRPPRRHPAPALAACPPRDVLVVAHRGDSISRAEHTVDAYRAALDAGADGLECDVRLSRDGHLVCVHDRRVDRTSNGAGVVSELELQRLQELDFASWHEAEPDTGYLHGVVPARDAAGGVLTLDMLLTTVADAGRPVRLLIETKHPTRYAGLVEQTLMRSLRRFGYGPGGTGPAGSVAVMSFAAIALRRIRLLAPAQPTVLLQERLLPGRRDGRLPTGTTISGVGLSVLQRDPGYVARAHRRGNQVYVWTVDDPADVELALDLGADAIITNDPRLTIELRDNQL